MSVLDVFYILFKADTTDLEKGGKEAVKQNKNLQNQVKSTQDSVQGLQLSLVDLATDAAAAVASLFTVGKAISTSMQVEEHTLAFGRMADAIGMNVTKMDMFDRELKHVAGSGASIEGVFANLTKELNRSVATAGGYFVSLPINAFATGMQANGISTFVKDAGDLLLKEAQKIDQLRAAGATPQQLFAFSTDQLKNDASTTMFILRGYTGLMEDFQRIKDTEGLITPDDVITAKRFAFEFQLLNLHLRGILQHDLTSLLKWVMALDPQKVHDFGVALGVVGASVALLTIDFAALAATAIPIILLTEAVMALYLLIQKWPDLEEKFTWLKDVSAWVNSLTDDLGRLLAVMQVFVTDLIKGKSLIESMADARAVMNEQYDGATGKSTIIEEIKRQHAGAGDSSSPYEHYMRVNGIAREQLALADGSPLNSSSAFMQNFMQQQSSASHSMSIGEMHVHTQGTDAATIAQAIGDHMRNTFSGALLQFDDGVHS